MKQKTLKHQFICQNTSFARPNCMEVHFESFMLCSEESKSRPTQACTHLRHRNSEALEHPLNLPLQVLQLLLN